MLVDCATFASRAQGGRLLRRDEQDKPGELMPERSENGKRTPTAKWRKNERLIITAVSSMNRRKQDYDDRLRCSVDRPANRATMPESLSFASPASDLRSVATLASEGVR